MIQLNGSLDVKTVQGRRGDFNVGKLQTDIGVFAIENATLDQYPEGTYNGVFTLTSIFANAYPVRNRGISITEVRAEVSEMVLDAFDTQREPENVPVEQDASLPVKTDSPTEQVALDVDTGETDSPSVLFGVLWPIGDTVRLDATLDRSTLQAQRDYLKAHGYRFLFKTQFWSKTTD